MADEDQRISEIIDRLDLLTIEASTLTGELRELRNRRERSNQRAAQREVPRQTRAETFDHGFVSGDEVVITNLCQGFRGTRGTVTNVTQTYVTLRDATGRLYTRKYTNVRKIT